MKCVKCGRKLKDKRSQERGYGPVCWKKSKEDPNLVDMLREGDEDDTSQSQGA
ncbi:DUF6011 domain-containing protein [Alteribacillus sp. YIM 98480]|uniref:DUF6011 domain-containing protein n=1 Tax=Alteribacillus sp. YIM 98480 TaxID=2606599 RepID=UPI00351B4213